MVKVAVVGNTNAGKTTLVHRMVYNTLPPEPLQATIGADFHVFPCEDRSIHIWDTGNLEKFAQISRHYYRKTDLFVIVYDCVNPVSACAALSKWHTILSEQCDAYPTDVKVVAVRTKCDRIQFEAPSIVKVYCEQHNMKHMSVSATENINVQDVVDYIFYVSSDRPRSISLTTSARKPTRTCPRCT